MAPLEKAICHRKEFIEINDLERYKRCRVQLHAQGVVLRDIVQGTEIKTKKQQMCRAGEFLVAEIDAKHGGFGIVPEDLEGAIVSSHYFLFEINQEVLERRFLDFFIRTPAFREQVSAQGSTNYAAIRPNDVFSYKIPLPLLDEQRRIVTRIEELAAKIEEARSLRQESAESVFALIASLHLNLSGERIVSLKDFLRLDEEREEIEYGKEYPQVGVKGFGQGLFARETLNASQTTYKAFNRLYEGAVVLSQVKGWEGALAICPSDLAGRYVSPEYRTFRCTPEEALPKYLGAIFSTPWFWTRLSSLSRGVGGRRERIRPEHFLGLEIPMPTVGQQKQAVSVFEALEKVRSLQIESAAELDALLPAILDKAFKGEL
jgi:type I restriction enzyme S subunit